MPAAGRVCKGLTLPEAFQATIWHLMQCPLICLLKEILPLKALKKKKTWRKKHPTYYQAIPWVSHCSGVSAFVSAPQTAAVFFLPLRTSAGAQTSSWRKIIKKKNLKNTYREIILMRLFTSGLCLISPFPLSQIQMVWCTHSASSHTWTSTTNFTDNGISSNITSYSPKQCCSRESTPPPDRRNPQEPGGVTYCCSSANCFCMSGPYCGPAGRMPRKEACPM